MPFGCKSEACLVPQGAGTVHRKCLLSVLKLDKGPGLDNVIYRRNKDSVIYRVDPRTKLLVFSLAAWTEEN